jgi:hypothetical protein
MVINLGTSDTFFQSLTPFVLNLSTPLHHHTCHRWPQSTSVVRECCGWGGLVGWGSYVVEDQLQPPTAVSTVYVLVRGQFVFGFGKLPKLHAWKSRDPTANIDIDI